MSLFWGPEIPEPMFKYEADPDFNPSDPETWYDGDLIKFKDSRVIGTQCIFSILKIDLKRDKIRVLVNRVGHGEWFNLDDVVFVARPLFP